MNGKTLKERIAQLSTMAVTDTYIRKSFDNLNEANRLVVDYIVGLKIVGKKSAQKVG